MLWLEKCQQSRREDRHGVNSRDGNAYETKTVAFPGRGVPTGARGAKVAWKVVCSSTKSGVLGL